MGLLNKGFYYSVLEKMERFCYKKAHMVLGQSLEILEHVTSIFPGKKTFLYRNFPSFDPPSLKANSSSNKNITLVYAGLLGVAQGVYDICKAVTLPQHISLHIYGAGPEAKMIETLQNDQIIFHGEVSREKLHNELQQYDIAFIPLVNRIYGSVPSKIFEYTRLGLPVLYFAGGEGEMIVKNTELGWTLPVDDKQALQSFIDELSPATLEAFPKNVLQNRAVKAFDFTKQLESLLDEVATV